MKAMHPLTWSLCLSVFSAAGIADCVAQCSRIPHLPTCPIAADPAAAWLSACPPSPSRPSGPEFLGGQHRQHHATNSTVTIVRMAASSVRNERENDSTSKVECRCFHHPIPPGCPTIWIFGSDRWKFMIGQRHEETKE